MNSGLEPINAFKYQRIKMGDTFANGSADAAIQPASVMRPFTSETGRAAGLRTRANRWRDYKQAIELQSVMVDIAKDREIKAGERASSARVWVDLFYARRVMLGLGDPKSVPASNDPAAAPRKRKQGTAKTEASDGPSDGPA